MNDGTQAAPQAGTDSDWVDQFRAHVETTYPQVYLWVVRSGVRRPEGERRHVIIETIRVDKDARNRGLARTVLTELCAQADKHGDTLSVTPNSVREASWTATPRRWSRFFRRTLGFVSNRTGRGRDFSIRETMYRLPKPAATEAGQ